MCRNVTCKLLLPLTTGTISGGDCNTWELTEPNSNSFTLPSPPRMAPPANGRCSLHGTLQNLKNLLCRSSCTPLTLLYYLILNHWDDKLPLYYNQLVQFLSGSLKYNHTFLRICPSHLLKPGFLGKSSLVPGCPLFPNAWASLPIIPTMQREAFNF